VAECCQERLVSYDDNKGMAMECGCLTVGRLLAVAVLQDVEGHAGLEAAELVGEQRDEATSEVWRRQRHRRDERGGV